MKKFFTAILVGILAIAGCTKSTDNASAWVGTYTGTGLTNTVNQVTISEVNSSTLKIQLQVTSGGLSYTFATMQAAKLQSASTVTINETGPLYGYGNANFQYTGTGTLSGNSLLLEGQGQEIGTDSSAKIYYFTGSK